MNARPSERLGRARSNDASRPAAPMRSTRSVSSSSSPSAEEECSERLRGPSAPGPSQGSSAPTPLDAEAVGAPEPPGDGLSAALEPSGWDRQAGFRLVRAGREMVVLQWRVTDRHRQPFGIVHGGVHCSAIETACSIGAQLAAPPGTVVVGVENHTSFLRPVREGELTATATPVHTGRRAQLWECNIVDGRGRKVASGRLRVMSLQSSAGEGAPHAETPSEGA